MAKKLTRAEKIRRYLKVNPDMALKDVAARFDTTYQVVYMVRKNMREDEWQPSPVLPIPETRGAWVHRWIDTNKLEERHKDALASQLITMEEPASDPINHPAHYKVGGIETIDFIEAKKLNYNLGNAVKYVTLADHKGSRKEDLEKARWYINREIEQCN
jgi:hypothetical protein